MFEILILVATLFLAKHPKRRRRYNLRRVRVTPELALLTLASDTALVVSMTGVATSSYRAMSLKGTWAVTNLATDEGPITVGFCHSDYTVAEIKESIESFAAIDQGNKIAQERAGRLIRIVGQLGAGITNLNEGRPIKTRLNWLITIGAEVKPFVYNEDPAALATGAVVHFTGDMWVKDSA